MQCSNESNLLLKGQALVSDNRAPWNHFEGFGQDHPSVALLFRITRLSLCCSGSPVCRSVVHHHPSVALLFGITHLSLCCPPSPVCRSVVRGHPSVALLFRLHSSVALLVRITRLSLCWSGSPVCCSLVPDHTSVALLFRITRLSLFWSGSICLSLYSSASACGPNIAATIREFGTELFVTMGLADAVRLTDRPESWIMSLFHLWQSKIIILCYARINANETSVV